VGGRGLASRLSLGGPQKGQKRVRARSFYDRQNSKKYIQVTPKDNAHAARGQAWQGHRQATSYLAHLARPIMSVTVTVLGQFEIVGPAPSAALPAWAETAESSGVSQLLPI
jgi:hypothetical protein